MTIELWESQMSLDGDFPNVEGNFPNLRFLSLQGFNRTRRKTNCRQSFSVRSDAAVRQAVPDKDRNWVLEREPGKQF